MEDVSNDTVESFSKFDDIKPHDTRYVNEYNFVHVKYSTKKISHNFVGKVQEIHDENAVQVRLLVRPPTKEKFDYLFFVKKMVF